MGVMTAVICALAPFSIPIGVIPISLTNFAVLLAVYILGMKKGTISLCCYILIGAVGVPVFSGFSGGIAKILGPTGGYIVGFIPLAVITGIFLIKTNKWFFRFLGMVLGTAVLYAFGTAWFCLISGADLHKALWGCVIPFIPGDLIKIIIVLLIGPPIKKGLAAAGLLSEQL